MLYLFTYVDLDRKGAFVCIKGKSIKLKAIYKEDNCNEAIPFIYLFFNIYFSFSIFYIEIILIYRENISISERPV